VKSNPRTLARTLDVPDPDVRFYLFHGYDPAQSRAHGERLLKSLVAEKGTLPASSLRTDPAMLADEAGAIGLFGGKRILWIEPAGEEIVEAVEALLQAGAAESPTVAVAGALRKTSKLLQVVEAHPLALAHQSYELSGRDIEQLIQDLAMAEGLRLAAGVAAQIAAAANGERGIIAQELSKLALYTDASPESPALLDSQTLEAVGAGSEGDWIHLGDLALIGDAAKVAEVLSRTQGLGPIALIRAMHRRLLMLAPLRARVDEGKRPHEVMASAGKSIFFKDKELVTKLLSMWDSLALARVSERVGTLERELMRADPPPDVEALGEELVAIARAARRR
jgi:DNA polymerase III subunit delta